MSKVSIIIPVYNVDKYLERCLNSVLKQTHTNLEIICVNDGSPDSSLDILKKYEKQDGRVKVIDKENGGVSSARNVGLSTMTGEYVLFLDADDWIEEEAIEKLLCVAKKENVEIVRATYFNNINEEESIQQNSIEKKFQTKEGLFKNDIFTNILKGILPGYACLFFTKANIIKDNKIVFDEKIHFMEDLMFVIEILTKSESVYFLNYPFYHYFTNDAGATRSSDKYLKNIECMPEVYERIKEVLLNSDFCDKKYIEIRKNANIKSIMSYAYLIFKTSKDKNDFKNKMDCILNNEKIYSFISDYNLILLGSNVKNYIENFFCKLLVNRKYNLLYDFYSLRKKTEKLLQI